MFRMNTGIGDGIPELMLIYIVLMALATIVVHLAFAVAVLSDSPPRRVMVGQSIWALGALIAGPLVAGLYWLLHRGLPGYSHDHAASDGSPIQP